jgi:hypothetical protein
MTTNNIDGTWLALGAVALASAAGFIRRGSRSAIVYDPGVELAGLRKAGQILVSGGPILDASKEIVVSRWHAQGRQVTSDPAGFRAEIIETVRHLQGPDAVDWLDGQLAHAQAATSLRA